MGQVPARVPRSSLTVAPAGTERSAQHPRSVKPSSNDVAVGLSQSCCQDMQVMSADIVDPAMRPEISVVRSRATRRHSECTAVRTAGVP